MNADQIAKLRNNDRVKFTEDGIEGTVIDHGYCAITVSWDDGQTGMIDFDHANQIEAA